MSSSIKTIDITKKQEVSYCIPLWLRDEQIAYAIRHVKGRIQPYADVNGRRDAEGNHVPVAIACFGPSLRDTWEEIKKFPFVISCSGAHKFLIEHGIIPNWHTAVDPLPGNTVKLIGEPHKDVEYLIASTCHPDVLEHLKEFNLKLWHVFDTMEEGLRVLPFGEHALTGGCDIGSRSITIAAFLGFRDIHVFGMDGSQQDSSKHAGEHPGSGQLKGYSLTTYDGVEYRTTPALAEAARQLWHELDELPAVKVQFYGEGLVQHMARHYKKKEELSFKPLVNRIAYMKPELISDEYRELNTRLHNDNLAYGVGGGRHAQDVANLCANLGTTSVLDYGCGKGYLAKALAFPIWEYDPAIPEKSNSPRPADIVVCTDVLEHIEPEKLPYVIFDLKRCVKRIGYFVINTGPAQKKLADGRNTHLIQKPEEWWVKKLSKFFKVGVGRRTKNEIHIIVEPLGKVAPTPVPVPTPVKVQEPVPIMDIETLPMVEA